MSSIHRIRVRQGILRLEISENGFAPSASSILLAENFVVEKGEVVGDIGTGSGIQAIVAAKLGAKEVHATDVNPYDLIVARRNIVLNRVEDAVRIYEGGMLEPVPQTVKFDVVVFNLPQAPVPVSRITKPTQFALFAGGDGAKQILKAISAAEKRLVKGGRVYFPLDSLANPKRVEEALRRRFDFRIIASIKAPFRLFELELLPVYERMRENGKCVFHYKSKVPMYEKNLYECVLLR